jgi:hypothetical protein
MKSFLSRFGALISLVLSGFDRLRFRGEFRGLNNGRGVDSYLYQHKIRYTDFPAHTVFRTKEGQDGDAPKAWQRMRKGVADLDRRAEVSQAANHRLAESLATVAQTAPLGELLSRWANRSCTRAAAERERSTR